VDAA
jgi:predicted acylesterase/phospholipase RssA